MIKYIKYLLLLLLFPTISYGQVIISGEVHILGKGNGNIFLSGDFTNNYTGSSGYEGFHSYGKVFFQGSALQTIGGTNDNFFIKNFEMNNSAGLNMTNDYVYVKNLHFVNGKITHTGIVLIEDGGNTSGASSNSYVIGSIKKLGSNDFIFPIGDANVYAPIEVKNIAGGDAMYTAEYKKHTPPNNTSIPSNIVKLSDVEYWNLTDFNNRTADVVLHWQSSKKSGIGSDLSHLYFAHYDGSAWDYADAGSKTGSGGLSSDNSGTIKKTSVSVFEKFTFGSDDNIVNPLPIQLLSFTAQCQNHDVILEWSTAAEINNDYFTLLRSEDYKHYQDVAQIVGAGNSNNVVNYRFTDFGAADGIYYYMLKQTDYDGKSEIFSPIHVNCGTKKELSLDVFYDGAQPYALLSNANSSDRYTVVIIDYTGRIVLQETQTVNSQNYYRIPKENLAKGVYSIIYYNSSSVRLNQKFMVY